MNDNSGILNSWAPSKRTLASGFVLLAAMQAGCSDNNDDNDDNASSGAQYLVHMSIPTPDDRLNLFVPVESLDEGMVVDPAQGLEVPGLARLYAPPSGGFFSVGRSSDLTITRYDLSTEGDLIETGTVSFQNYGLDRFTRTVAFINEHKAYYLDEGNARIIVWDPTALAITGTIDLSIAAREEMELKFVRQNYALRPGRLITTVTWASPTGETLARETGLLVIDTDDDQVLRFDVDARCAGAAEIVELPNGDIYFATGPDEVVDNAEIRGSLERPACVLRIKAGEEHFDPNYLLSLSDLVDGRVACNILPDARENAVLFRVLDETRAEWSLENDAVGEAAAWEWWRLSVESGAAELAPELDVTTVYTNYTLVGERVMLTRELAGTSESEFVELEPNGGVRVGLRAPGFLWAAAKIR